MALNGSGANAGSSRLDASARCSSPVRCPSSFDFFRINAADQFLEKSTGRRCFILKIGFALQHSLVIAADGVHSERPNVAFVGDRALQETNDSRFRFWPAIFESPRRKPARLENWCALSGTG